MSDEFTLWDAINAVCTYLHRQESVFTLYRAWQMEQGFKVTVHQQQPEDTYRAFDVLPGNQADCFDVKEVEFAGSATQPE